MQAVTVCQSASIRAHNASATSKVEEKPSFHSRKPTHSTVSAPTLIEDVEWVQ